VYRLLAGFLSFLTPVALAQSSATPAVHVPGETIVVTADRLPEPLENTTDSVSVITAADLERAQVTSVAEALRDLAGLNVVQSGSAGHATSVFVRGANSAQLLVLVDGVEIDDPFFGGVDFGALSTSGVERIEVVRGAQSPLYGSAAMAGVINIITAPSGRSNGVGGTLRAEAGSLSTNHESLQLGGGSGALQWKLGGSHLDTAGQLRNDEYRNVQLNANLLWNLATAATLRLHGFASDGHIGIPFNGATRTLERNSDSRLGAGGVDYTNHVSPWLNLEAGFNATKREDDFTDPEDPFSTSSSHDSTLWKATVQNTILLHAQTVTLGVEQKHEDVVAASNAQPALDETIRTTAVYGQDKIEAGKLLFTAGARVDHHSRFGSHTSPRLSAAYALSPHWRVRAAAGRAFRSPSAGELAYPFYGNPDLEPETSRSYEAGIDMTGTNTSVSVTGFSSSYHDLISFDPLTFVAANINRATVRGAELTAGMRISTPWRVGASYTHLLTRDESTGLPLYRRPRNVGSVTVSYVREVWSVSGDVNAVGRRFETDFATFTDRYNPGYAKFDLAGTYRLLPSLQLTARVENLFDREYAEALAFPATGRTIYGGFRFGLE
jgi:vitamin B12 transporter